MPVAGDEVESGGVESGGVKEAAKPPDYAEGVEPASPIGRDVMDEEAKQLLREIRDALVKQEDMSRKFKRFVFVIVVVLLSALAYLLVRLGRIMDGAEQVAPPASAVQDGPINIVFRQPHTRQTT
jgi:hypothetical protein